MKDVRFIQVKNENEGAEVVLTIVQNLIEQNELRHLGLATGGTMIPIYKAWTESEVDFSNVTTFNLDEYVGIGADNPNGYAYFMYAHLFNKKKFKRHHLLDGLAEDLEAECLRYENLLDEMPVDLQLLGVGENGHIAFNEPGTPFHSVTHVARLTPSTIKVNSRFFKEGEKVPNTALTMGIQSILKSRKIILIAFGEKKRAALEKLKEGKIDATWPITKLLEHEDLTVVTDLSL